jgi:hypothetical protein
VRHERAFNAWLDTTPNLDWLTRVLEWVRGLPHLGPPSDAKSVGDSRYVYEVPGTKVSARYLVVPYEYLILIKDFV